MRTVIIVSPGQEGAGVYVNESPAGDQAKLPLVAGLVENPAITLLVSIGWLNCTTSAVSAGIFVESCAGEMLVTTGLSGSRCDCARKIFTEVLGTRMGGVCGPART